VVVPASSIFHATTNRGEVALGKPAAIFHPAAISRGNTIAEKSLHNCQIRLQVEVLLKTIPPQLADLKPPCSLK
jgi:hypothetical protein